MYCSDNNFTNKMLKAKKEISPIIFIDFADTELSNRKNKQTNKKHNHIKRREGVRRCESRPSVSCEKNGTAA